VRRGRHEIGDEGGRLAARLDDDHLMVHRVAASASHPYSRHDGLIVIDELKHAGIGQRQEVFRQIARAIAIAGVGGISPLAATDDVLGARKPRADAAARVPCREPARVIEMEMGRQHDVDVLG
jgi:hypothetical protein